jgi:predicted RNA-binding Zn ribbon-like protein
MLDPALRYAESLLSTTLADVVGVLPDEHDAARRLNAALLHADAAPQVVAYGSQWRIVIAGPTPVAEALAALAVLVTVGGWRRLKPCARCGRPFVDRTNGASRQRCLSHLRARTSDPA